MEDRRYVYAMHHFIFMDLHCNFWGVFICEINLGSFSVIFELYWTGCYVY